MKITLVHNPDAGSGQEPDGWLPLIREAGHDVRHLSRKKGWQKLLQEPIDLLVAAGGDGTVQEVALAAADRALRFAAIPVGTANNIAKTLDVPTEARALVQSWSASPRSERPFDIGEVVAPWGRERFVEGIGGGLVADLLRRSAEPAAGATLLGREMERALQLLCELVREAPLRHWRIRADGVDLSGDYLAVEVLNIRFVGPNLPLAPAADPCDGLFDVVRVGASDRAALLDYLEDRLKVVSAQLPELQVTPARDIEIVAPAGVGLRVDDRNWPSEEPLGEATSLSVKCLAGAATFVGAADK